MAKIIRTQRAKRAAVRSLPKKSAARTKASSGRTAKKAPKAPKPGLTKPGSTKLKASKSKTSKPKISKPWTPEEVREAFSRFQKANPEPRGELEHLNPFTLLVAVVLSAQATDAGVNRATREL